MKSIKNLLVAVAALASAVSVASVMQPGIPVNEDSPIRISAGLIGGMANNNDKLGVNKLGLGLGFAHNVGYDFEYGLSVGGDWASPGFRVFTQDAKDKTGMRVDVELMARFMPEVAEKFHFGGVLGAGWGRQFGKFMEEGSKNVTFGDLSFFVGPALSYGFTDAFALYFAPGLTMTGVRFLKDSAGQAMKDNSNLFGLRAPVGFWFSVADTTALYLEVDTKLSNFKAMKAGWSEDVTFGVSFSI